MKVEMPDSAKEESKPKRGKRTAPKTAAKTSAPKAKRQTAPKIPGDKLKRAINLLSLAPAEQGNSSSMYVGMQSADGCLKLSLSSIISVEVKVDCDLKIPENRAVDRRLLFPFVLQGGDTGYTLKITDENLVIQQGRRKASILTTPAEWGYGDWESAAADSRRVSLPDAVADILRAGKLCASTDSAVPKLNVIHAEYNDVASGPLTAMACNDLVLGFAEIGAPQDGGEAKAEEKPKKAKKTKKPKKAKKASSNLLKLLFPIGVVDSLIKEKVGEILVSGQVMGFETEEARVWAQSPEEAWSVFPKEQMEGLLASAGDAATVLACASKDLSEICSGFAKYLGNVPSAEWDLEIRIENKKARVRAVTSAGEFSDDLKAEADADAMVTVNLALMSPIVDFFADHEERVQIAATDALCVLSAGNYRFLLSRKAS